MAKQWQQQQQNKAKPNAKQNKTKQILQKRKKERTYEKKNIWRLPLHVRSTVRDD